MENCRNIKVLSQTTSNCILVIVIMWIETSECENC